MADIRINQLPAGGGPVATDFLALDNGSTRKATVQAVVEVGRPTASQAEAEAGTNPVKVMTPLTTKQAVTFYGLLQENNLNDVDSPSSARANLGLAIGSDVQAYDAALLSIAGLTTAADQMIYTTGTDVYATTALTPFARTLLDDANAAAMRATIGLGNSATLNVGTTAGTVAAGDDTRIVGAAQRSSLKLNVLDPPYLADKTGVANSTPAFQAAYDAANEGQSIVVPEGQYNLVTGVSGTKNVYWEVEGEETLVSFNWSDVLPGIVVQTGKRTLTAGVPIAISGRTDIDGLSLTTPETVDYVTYEIRDNVLANRVRSFRVSCRIQTGATGIRDGLLGYTIIEGSPGLTPGGFYAVGLTGYSGAVAPSLNSDAVHASNFFAELFSGATGYENVTGGEANVLIHTGASAAYRTAFQLVGGGEVRGSTYDVALAFSNLAGAVRFKTLMRSGNMNGQYALDTDSTVFEIDEQTISVGFDFKSTVVTSYMVGTNINWTPTSLQLLAPNQTLLIGKRDAVNTPTLRMYSSGNTNSDVNLVATDGTGADDGTLTANVGILQIGGETIPTVDNGKSIGSSIRRFLKGWFQNISLFPPASVTPTVNGEVTFQLTSNTQLTIKVRGSDGVVRSNNLTLS